MRKRLDAQVLKCTQLIWDFISITQNLIMPSEPDKRTLLIPVNLGTPAQYDRSIFPLMRLKDQSGLAQADLVLEATLDEVFKIHDMAADKTQFQDLVSATKLAYDKLVLERDRLEQQKKSINPVNLSISFDSVARGSREKVVHEYQDHIGEDAKAITFCCLDKYRARRI